MFKKQGSAQQGQKSGDGGAEKKERREKKREATKREKSRELNKVVSSGKSILKSHFGMHSKKSREKKKICWQTGRSWQFLLFSNLN